MPPKTKASFYPHPLEYVPSKKEAQVAQRGDCRKARMTSRTLKLIEGSSLGLYKLLPSLPGLPSGSSLCSLDLPLSRDVFSKTKKQGYVCMNCQGGREGVGGEDG